MGTPGSDIYYSQLNSLPQRSKSYVLSYVEQIESGTTGVRYRTTSSVYHRGLQIFTRRVESRSDVRN